jgi:glycosyltransferase involved in cell wall biosynthesis
MSCEKINQNLLSAYSQQLSPVELVSLKDDDRISYQVTREIISEKPSAISFVDHRLSPMELLRFQDFVNFLREEKIKLLIHVYGSFIERLQEYKLVASILQGVDVTFLTGSGAQQKVVESFLMPFGSSVVTLPFPLKVEDYAFSSEARDATRQRLGFNNSDQLVLYLGRISFGKNVELALHAAQVAREKNPALKFLVAGPFDDWSLPFSRKDFASHGYSAGVFTHTMKKLDPNGDWIRYHPPIPRDELQNIFSAADTLISLSTQRGEDFGMVVPEALSAGLPCLITAWGGYQEFKFSPLVQYAPVILQQEVAVDLTSTIQWLETFKPNDRLASSDLVESHLGVTVTSERLKEILARPFVAFRSIVNFDIQSPSSELVAQRGYRHD